MGLGVCYQGCECFGAKPEFDGVLAYLRSCATPRPTYPLPDLEDARPTSLWIL